MLKITNREWISTHQEARRCPPDTGYVIRDSEVNGKILRRHRNVRWTFRAQKKLEFQLVLFGQADKWFTFRLLRAFLPCLSLRFCYQTSNSQRLKSAGDNDRRSKRFCSSAVLCVRFTWQVVRTRVIRLRVIEDPNARAQSAFCAFRTFLVEVQTNAGYIHATHA